MNLYTILQKSLHWIDHIDLAELPQETSRDMEEIGKPEKPKKIEATNEDTTANGEEDHSDEEEAPVRSPPSTDSLCIQSLNRPRLTITPSWQRLHVRWCTTVQTEQDMKIPGLVT